MKNISTFLILALSFLSACETANEFEGFSLNTMELTQLTNQFEDFDLNSVDLTKITGEPYSEQTFFDSALWPVIVGSALLLAASSGSGSNNYKDNQNQEMDSEWIE